VKTYHLLFFEKKNQNKNTKKQTHTRTTNPVVKAGRHFSKTAIPYGDLTDFLLDASCLSYAFNANCVDLVEKELGNVGATYRKQVFCSKK